MNVNFGVRTLLLLLAYSESLIVWPSVALANTNLTPSLWAAAQSGVPL